MVEPSNHPKLKKSVQQDATFSQITPDDLAAVHRTLQAAYIKIRKEKAVLERKVNKTFRKHPIRRRGQGWVYHYCGRDCYRRHGYEGKGPMVHHFEEDDGY